MGGSACLSQFVNLFRARTRAVNVVVPEHYHPSEHASQEWTVEAVTAIDSKDAVEYVSPLPIGGLTPSRHSLNAAPALRKLESRTVIEKHSGLLETMRKRKTSLNSLLTMEQTFGADEETTEILAKHAELLHTLRLRRESRDLLLGAGATIGGIPCCLDGSTFSKTKSLFVGSGRGLCPEDQQTFSNAAAALATGRSYSEADVRHMPPATQSAAC